MTAMQRQAGERAQRVIVGPGEVDAAQRQLAEAAKQRRAIETLRDQQQERWRADRAAGRRRQRTRSRCRWRAENVMGRTAAGGDGMGGDGGE